MMTRNLLIFVFFLNVILLVWGARNYYYLSKPVVDNVTNQIIETAALTQQSAQIMADYTSEQKHKNIDSVINLYIKLSDHLDATKGSHIEAIDSLFNDTYLILLISIINILTLLYAFKLQRHNKTLNQTGAKNAPPS